MLIRLSWHCLNVKFSLSSPLPLFFAIFFSPFNGAGEGKENVALSSSSLSEAAAAAAAAAGGDTSRID